MGEKGVYTPVEGDVVDPLQQAVGSGFGVAGVMVVAAARENGPC